VGAGGRGGRWFWRAQWVLVPLAVLGLTEAVARLTVDRVPTWYGAAERLASTHPIGAIFVGSSRVQAAILPAAFEQALAARDRPGLIALNLGRGYSTDQEHFLGLRNMLAAHPANLRGVTVFAETLSGLPFPSRWTTTPWARAEQPWMLVDLMRPSDLPGFWASLGLGFEQRLYISFRVALRRLALVNRRERLRERWIEEVLPALASGRRPVLGARPLLGYDLQGPGQATSIRADPAAMAFARQLARQVSEQLASGQRPIREWGGTIAEDLVRLVQRGGGRVVFFDVPQSETFLRAYRTPVRQEDAAVFSRQAKEWGACVVRPGFSYSDEDLPDFWHLRLERVAEYTRALAAAWLDTCGGPP
jgi:hypothetical protein